MSDRGVVVPHDARAGSPRVGSGGAALWASAFVLAGLLIVQASGGVGEAVAESANTSAGRLEIATAKSSGGEDMIIVIDNASEKLLLYTVTAGRGLELRQSRNLEDLFPASDNR